MTKSILAWHFKDKLPAGFLENIKGNPTKNECWVWSGKTNFHGYGYFYYRGQPNAYKVSYLHVIGIVPSGLELDHVCRNKKCVNPFHLEPVTHRENIKRGIRFWQKCPHGDEYRQKSNRTCTVCANKRRRERYHENKKR